MLTRQRKLVSGVFSHDMFMKALPGFAIIIGLLVFGCSYLVSPAGRL
jgi:hypothetical protein